MKHRLTRFFPAIELCECRVLCDGDLSNTLVDDTAFVQIAACSVFDNYDSAGTVVDNSSSSSDGMDGTEPPPADGGDPTFEPLGPIPIGPAGPA